MSSTAVSREAAARILSGLGDATLVLASASPRRAAMLRELRIPFTVRAVAVDETPPVADPAVAAVYLAEKKARAAADDTGSSLVLAADTLVDVDGHALGKPENRAQAADMLRSLSGRSHEVVTGVAVFRESDQVLHAEAERTRVVFRSLSEADVTALVESGDGDDKAGAYGIQSLAALAVERVVGDYTNVVGLPLHLLRRLLIRATQGDER